MLTILILKKPPCPPCLDFFQNMQEFLTLALQKLCKFFKFYSNRYKSPQTANLWICAKINCKKIRKIKKFLLFFRCFIL